ncbi:receptor-type tyrosine-protein phosphatase mu-like [Argopecten irradians]|uniref:receptor-type tyrosine-protein phosphatase mu-like n=1 Tax=Argopecten irradians TaxID=31199 RepID=UPI003715C964
METKKIFKGDIILILFSLFDATQSAINVAVGKQAEQNGDTNEWGPDRAVDNCTDTDVNNGCCSHTTTVGRPTNAYWDVNFGTVMTINDITIYYRVGFADRFAGYQIYVYNTTGVSPTLCYSDMSSDISDVKLTVTHQCPYVTRYVKVYNYRVNPKRQYWYSDDAILELCEVQVWGCQVGRYGDGNCDSACSRDCLGGNCNATNGDCFYCVPQKYGYKCENNCSINCLNQICERDTGNCNDCVPTKFGTQCNEDCSVNCLDRFCERKTGTCIDCVPKKFGRKCDESCSVNCLNQLCERDNGTCNECVIGRYGKFCESKCSAYCNNTCAKDTGHCLECTTGRYGDSCELECPNNCQGECDKVTGHCTECNDGFYGEECSMACSRCTECHQSNGECIECVSGYYGQKCNVSCGHCASCHRVNGSCLSSCDAGYQREGHFCKITQTPDTSTSDAGAIAGIVVGVLVVAAVAIVIVIFFRRRRFAAGKQEPNSTSNVNKGNTYREHTENGDQHMKYRKTQKKVHRNTPDPDRDHTDSANVYLNIEEVSRKSGPGDNVYYNNSSPMGIPISDLKSMVETKLQNKAKAFENEYKSIPSGALHDHDIGKLNQNKAKNRFKSTFPYDHSRVVLETVGKDPHSDYINANYIDSVTKSAEYIATQGPRPGTVNDFWRMIWQLNTGKIVMLTNLIEGGRPKCDKYWPDEGQPLTTTNFNIILDRERSYAFYIIRDLTVTEKKTKTVRPIHQFHYTTWPDHGTPDPNELIVFHRRVKNYEARLTGKMVAHCSAGIGRTGTFLALDALLDYGKETGNVDVLQYIKIMRKDRVNMVQTAEQYIAVHQLLIEAFEMPDTLIPRMKFQGILRALTNGGPANQTKIRKEYQLIQSTKPNYSEADYKTALLPSNKMKNQTLSVLAGDDFRVYLLSHDIDRTDYINAVSVPSYTSKTGYIVTQTPLEDTVVDLLTMIMDHNCQTLVVIDTDAINWLPDENSEDKWIGEFRLERKEATTTISNVDVHDIAIESAEKSFTTTIRVFHMNDWDRDSPVPQGSSVLLQLMELVDSRRKSDDTKTTVVMCRDGYSQSGLFCCISNARDQMKCDEEVDIYQISRQLLVRRPEFLTNCEQYQCCYSMIKDYIDTTNVYVN